MIKGTLRVIFGAVVSTALLVLFILLIVPLLNSKSATAAWGVSEVDGVVERFYADKFGRAFIGGEFTRVNDQPASNIALWEEGSGVTSVPELTELFVILKLVLMVVFTLPVILKPRAVCG